MFMENWQYSEPAVVYLNQPISAAWGLHTCSWSAAAVSECDGDSRRVCGGDATSAPRPPDGNGPAAGRAADWHQIRSAWRETPALISAECFGFAFQRAAGCQRVEVSAVQHEMRRRRRGSLPPSASEDSQTCRLPRAKRNSLIIQQVFKCCLWFEEQEDILNPSGNTKIY